jgi:hypothetical protein
VRGVVGGGDQKFKEKPRREKTLGVLSIHPL